MPPSSNKYSNSLAGCSQSPTPENVAVLQILNLGMRWGLSNKWMDSPTPNGPWWIHCVIQGLRQYAFTLGQIMSKQVQLPGLPQFNIRPFYLKHVAYEFSAHWSWFGIYLSTHFHICHNQRPELVSQTLIAYTWKQHTTLCSCPLAKENHDGIPHYRGMWQYRPLCT